MQSPVPLNAVFGFYQFSSRCDLRGAVDNSAITVYIDSTFSALLRDLMNYANRIIDGEVVEVFAEELINTPYGPHGYFCRHKGCGVDLTLCSYRTKNKKAPYFRPSILEKPHNKGCPGHQDVSGSKGSGEDPSEAEPYVNKLVFPRRSSSSRAPTVDSLEGDEVKRRRHDYDDSHNHTVRHIAPLIRWYVENPASGESKLEVPGCGCKSYAAIFQRIHSSPKGFYINRHIYFGSLLYKNPIDLAKSRISGDMVINIHQAYSKAPVQIFVETASWRKSEIELANSWIQKALDVSREGRKAGKNSFPWIFFLGEPKFGYSDFQCRRFEEFYAMACENLYLKTKNLALVEVGAKSPIFQSSDDEQGGAQTYDSQARGDSIDLGVEDDVGRGIGEDVPVESYNLRNNKFSENKISKEAAVEVFRVSPNSASPSDIESNQPSFRGKLSMSEKLIQAVKRLFR